MKYPLKDRPFERVVLSPARYLDLEHLIDAVVEANIEEYQHFVRHQNSTLDPSQWKPVKKRENVTVYKELTSREHRVLGPLGVRSNTAATLLPKLIATGTVHGNMHDMMLGLALHDAAATQVATSYVDDALVDCAVLHEMRGASHDDPFRYVALKWIVKGHPAGLNGVVAPRDMVLLQSSGLVKGTNLGYHVLHSVELPECPSLEGKYGILRSRISASFVFRQQSPEAVEVFVANYVEPNGNAPESVGVISSAKSMSGSWKAIGCAHNMKLSWILKNKDVYMSERKHESIVSDDKCELCFHKATFTGKLDDCALCNARACSRCRVTKKLSDVNRRLELNTTKHEFCKTCLYKAVNDDAKRIAAEMYGGERILPWRGTDASLNSDGARFDQGLRRGSADTHSSGWRSHRSTGSVHDDDVVSVRSDRSNRSDDSVVDLLERQNQTQYQTQYQHETQQQQLVPVNNQLSRHPSNYKQQYYYNTSSTQSDARTLTSSTDSGAGSDSSKREFFELYSQMQALQMAAEKTYELTKDNSRKLQYPAP